MGRTSDEEGETSTKTCKSDDNDDRPLKKARYVWQIKGKYHLKKPDEDKSSLFITKNEDCSTVAVNHCSSVGCESNSCKCEFEVIESNEDCAKSVDVKLSEDHKMLPEVQDSSSSLTSVAGSNADSNVNLENISPDNRSDVTKQPLPAGKVLRNNRVTSTWQLSKWQARQVARCFVDNTINRVLEDMGFVPLPVDADDILEEEFPMTESENDEGLEDEAVLMAIHSHGLQRTEGVNAGPGRNHADNSIAVELQSVKSRNKDSDSVFACACALARCVPGSDTMESLDPFHQRPVLWEQLTLDPEAYNELESVEHQCAEALKNDGNLHNWCTETSLFGSIISSDSSSDESDIKSCEENFVESIKQNPVDNQDDTGAFSVSQIEERVMQEPTKKVSESDSSDLQMEDKTEEKNSSSFEHNDFLDKAVAVAIQKKGLSTLSCADYG